MDHHSFFARFARWISIQLGHPFAFGIALLIVIGWAVVGPIFHFSDTWQLVINTGTTIITFLMVFIIQNTQNRDNEAMQVKLDEIIRAMKGANNDLLNMENASEKKLQEAQEYYTHLAQQAQSKLQQGNHSQRTNKT